MRVAVLIPCGAIALSTIALFTGGTSARAAEFAFEAQTIDSEPGKVVYAVAAADLDGDGKQDLVAVTENQVLWYQAPAWNKRIILDGQTQPDNVCVAAHDIDDDGRVDLALGAGWPQNGGTIQWLARGESLDDAWELYRIGEEGWVHRMRFADVLGTGRAQLVVSPLNATVAAGVRLLAFEIPENPRTDRWAATVLDESLNRLHNHWCLPPADVQLADAFPAETPAITLTASQEGVHAILPTTDQPLTFQRVPIAQGHAGDAPASQGAGEIKRGRLADGSVFLATIEPMHGTDVVIYSLSGDPRKMPPQREVLDDTLEGGHALWCADLDGDGDDEIVAGHREPSPEVGIDLYDRQRDGSWKKIVLDQGSVACEDLVIADFDGDGRGDILAGGRATHNVRLFLNRTASR